MRICPRQPLRTMSAAARRHNWVFVRACSSRMRSRRLQDVAERENPRVVNQHVYFDPLAAHGVPKFCGGLHACQIDRHDAHVAVPGRRPHLRGHGFQRFAAVSGQHQVVAQRRQPQGITASDARASARHQRPSAVGCDCPAFHHGRRLSSSTIFRGRSGQSLQHFMSTEYIRAMQ